MNAHRSLSLLLLLGVMPVGQALAEVTCDSLRNNSQSYDSCVQDWFGRSNAKGMSVSDEFNRRMQADMAGRRAREEEDARQAAESRARFEAEQAARRAAEERERQEQAKWQKDVEESRVRAAEEQARDLVQRELTLRRLAALSERVARKGAPTPEDSLELIAAAFPYWDLMQPQAERAARLHGGRFQLLLGLTNLVGCPEVNSLDVARNGVYNNRNPSKCDFKYHDAAVAQIHTAMKEGSRFDRLMVCALDKQWWQDHKVWFGEDAPESRKRLGFLNECRQQLGDTPAWQADDFEKVVRETYWPLTVLGGKDFFVFLHPRRDSIDPLNADAVRRVVRESRFREEEQLNIAEPGLQKHLHELAAKEGMNPEWTWNPPLPAALGHVAARELNLARAPGTPAFAAAPAGHNPGGVPARGGWEVPDVTWRKLDALAMQHRKEGRYEQALQAAGIALDFVDKTPDAPQERASDSLDEIGLILDKLGRHAEADAAFRRAIALRDAAGDTDSRVLRDTLSIYARYLEQQQRLADSEPVLKRLLPLRERRYGSSSAEADSTRLALVRAQMALQHWSEAEPLLRAQRQQQDARQEYVSANVAETRALLGEVLMAKGDVAAGADELEMSLRYRPLVLFPENPALAAASERAAAAFRRHGRSEAAEQAQALADRQREQARALQASGAPARSKSTPWEYVNDLESRTRALRQGGKEAEAADVAREWLAAELQYRDHYQQNEAAAALGQSLFNAGRPEQAEPYLLQVLAYREKKFKDSSKDMMQTYGQALDNQLDYVIALYDKRQQPAKVFKYLRQRSDVRDAIWGPTDRRSIETLQAMGQAKVAMKEDYGAMIWLTLAYKRAGDVPGLQNVLPGLRKDLLPVCERLKWTHVAGILRQDRMPAPWEFAWEEDYQGADGWDRDEFQLERRLNSARDSLKRAEKNGGPHHLYTVLSLERLAVQLDLGSAEQKAEAETTLLRAIAAVDRTTPPQPELKSALLWRLAMTYKGGAAGQDVKAEPLLERRLDLEIETNGKQHRRVADALTDLGELNAQIRDHKDAERYFKRALDVNERLDGKAGIYTLGSLNRLRDLYLAQNKGDKAKDVEEDIAGRRRDQKEADATAAKRKQEQELAEARQRQEKEEKERKRQEKETLRIMEENSKEFRKRTKAMMKGY